MLHLLTAFFVMASIASADIVIEVRSAIDRKDFAAAEGAAREYRARRGPTPDLIEAVSWLGRGELAEKHYGKADAYAAETRKLCLEALKHRPLDAEPHLPLALGAAIEVEAQVMSARGERGQAVAFLRGELKTYHDTSIRTRIQKNINLLSLEGKAAPALEMSEWLGAKPVPLDHLKGHPVLLFFWAHWCGDCKIEISAVARLVATFGPRGLAVIGPTQRYGYAAGGIEVSPQQELAYIDAVRQKYYARIGEMPAPVSEENFRNYGASTTPTLVLIDRNGIVRMYNPGRLAYEALAAKVERLLGP